MRTASLLAVACLAAPTLAHEAGYQDLVFTNTTPIGSASIPCRVYYPSTVAGLNAPVVPLAGGYPVVVYLHGFGWTGTTYATTGEALSEAGYVVALPETGQTSQAVQHDDAVALWTLLGDADATVGHPLEGLLDMSRAALSGHSMGANNTLLILAENPGYIAGLVLAPQDQGAAVNGLIDVPFGVIHGMGDTAIPYPHGLATFTNATSVTGMKFFYLFGMNGTHGNVALGGVGVTPAIWARSKRVQVGFYDCYLKGVTAGLEEVVGPTATSEPELSQLQVEVERTELWFVGTPTAGQTVRAEVMCEPGVARLYAATALGVTATPYGIVLLNQSVASQVAITVVGSSEHLLTWNKLIPASLAVGSQLHLQGLGRNNHGTHQWTGMQTLVVQ